MCVCEMCSRRQTFEEFFDAVSERATLTLALVPNQQLIHMYTHTHTVKEELYQYIPTYFTELYQYTYF